MRIISKFRDYYDSALQFGRDESILYKRFTEETSVNHVPRILRPSIPKPEDVPYEFSGEVHGFIIYFCGKIYNGFRLRLAFRNEHQFPFYGYHRKCFYSVEALNKFLVGKGKTKESKSKSRHENFTGGVTAEAKILEELGQGIEIKVIAERYIAEKTAVVAIEMSDIDYRTFVITKNPCLKDYDFIKVVDPFKAYQELSMYLGGIIAPENNPTVEIGDKYKIQEHGFDLKQSFRKRKKENH